VRRRPQIVWKAAALLAAGTAICAVISDPLVEAVSSFSKVTCPSANTGGLRPRDAPPSDMLSSLPRSALLGHWCTHTRAAPRMASAGCPVCIGAGS